MDFGSQEPFLGNPAVSRHAIPRRPVPSASITSTSSQYREQKPPVYISLNNHSSGQEVAEQTAFREHGAVSEKIHFDQRKNSTVLGWWKYELLASAIAIGSVIALILMLRHYNGRPLDAINLPASLQLSAVVAAIATIMRAALLVPIASALSQDSWIQHSAGYGHLKDLELSDNASRGPWGSLVFLCKARRRYLAYIGAVVTILSLGLSTLTQQLVFYQVSPLDHVNAGITNMPRSHSWSEDEGRTRHHMNTPLNPAIKAAVNVGFFAESIPQVPLACPTSNCSWPVTPSLAACGDCSQSTFTVQCDQYESCNFTTPSGISFNNEPDNLFSSYNSPGFLFNSTDPARAYFANFEFGGWNDTSGDFGTNNTFVAYECALWVCLRWFNASIQGSQQFTTPIVEYSEAWLEPEPPDWYDDMPLNWYLQIPPHSSDTRIIAPSDPTALNYTAENAAIEAIRYYMEPMLAGNISQALGPYQESLASSDVVQVLSQAVFHNSSNIPLTTRIDMVVESMSNVFRTAEPATSPEFNGTALTLSLAVQWAWLAMPVSLVVLSVLLSIINIIRTYRNGLGAWKGSPLAFLFSDVDPRVRAKAVESMNTPGGLLKSVGKEKAALRRSEEGAWVFEAE